MKTLAKAVHKSSFPAAVKQQADRSGALFQRKAANETEALSKIISSHNPVNSCSPSLSPNSGSKAAQLSTFIQRSGIQPELTIGQGGEKYEEVDSVAEGVMTMPEPPVKGQVEKPVQAKEADGKKSPPVPAAHSDIHSLPGARTKERTQMPYVQRRKGPVPAKCAKALTGHVTFYLDAGGIRSGFTCVKSGALIGFVNSTNRPINIKLVPANLFSMSSFTLRPGPLGVSVTVMRVKGMICGSIYVNPKQRGYTVRDICVCP